MLSTLPSAFEQVAPLYLSFLKMKVLFNPWSCVLLRTVMRASLWFHFLKINLHLWRTAQWLSNPVLGVRKQVTISGTVDRLLMVLWCGGKEAVVSHPRGKLNLAWASSLSWRVASRQAWTYYFWLRKPAILFMWTSTSEEESPTYTHTHTQSTCDNEY